jgi:hypothetical protein
MKIVCNGQHETSKMMRTVAIACVLLAVFMTGVEAIQSHSDAAFTAHSAPCAICLSAHAKAPTITVRGLPLIFTVETLALTYDSKDKSSSQELTLFIRPPPAA